jgi:hypothetical protein
MLLITNQSRTPTPSQYKGVTIGFVANFGIFDHRPHLKDLLATSSRYQTIA